MEWKSDHGFRRLGDEFRSRWRLEGPLPHPAGRSLKVPPHRSAAGLIESGSNRRKLDPKPEAGFTSLPISKSARESNAAPPGAETRD